MSLGHREGHISNGLSWLISLTPGGIIWDLLHLSQCDPVIVWWELRSQAKDRVDSSPPSDSTLSEGTRTGLSAKEHSEHV